jgi:hypothetical protein
MIKRSNVLASNPVKIDDFKRTTSSLAEAVKVKEGTFAAQMREASRIYKREDINNMNLTKIKPAGVQAIMEVEDMIANETNKGEDLSHYFTAENEELKVTVGLNNMPSFGNEEEKELIKNSPPSHDTPNYLENGTSSQDGNNRYSNIMGDSKGFMNKSYALRKESVTTTQEEGKNGSSNRGHLDNIAEEKQDF